MADSLREQLEISLGDAYALERELGGGGMSRVFLARDIRLERQVVIKVLSGEMAESLSAERFAREIKLAAALQEPHIVPVLRDGATADGVPYYIMPFVRGASLRSRMSDGPLAIADVVNVVRDIARALSYAHGRGIVHRDIKPENVLLSEGTAMVADFGIAKALAAATTQAVSRATTLTSAGAVIGTPAYMAPEQAAGDVATDGRADLYALGVIAYELLTGTHPFAGRSAHALVVAHMTETPARPRARRAEIPDALDALVMRLLAKDPAARPESADAVLRSLDGATPSRSAVPSRTRTTRVAALALVLLGMLTTGGYLAWRARSAAGAPIAGTDAPIRTVAVLPFVNTSGSPADDYFSDGLTDELAHALTRIAGLRIAGRTSSYAFKGKSVAAQEIGRALDVGALVGGTVRRAGDRLRVTTQLVSTVDGKVLWDSVYESRSADVFAVQDELTRAVVVALTPALGGGPRPRADAGRGTADGEAYDLYLKGRYYWLQRGGTNIRRAIGLLQQAVARDPSFARAHAALALAYSTLPLYPSESHDAIALDTLRVDDVTRLVASSADRAVSLDSTLADAQLALGIELDLRLQFRDALARYRRGAALDPSSVTAHHLLGLSLLNLGESDAAIVELRHATQLDPLNTIAAAALSTALFYARRFPETASQAHHVLALDSSFAFGSMMLAQAHVYLGAPDSAIVVAQDALRMHPLHPGLLRTMLLADAAAGRWSDAARVRDKLRALTPNDAGFADLVYGEPGRLARRLATAEGQRQYLGGGGILGCDPLLDPLRSDERFRDAMRKLTLTTCPIVRPLPVKAPPV